MNSEKNKTNSNWELAVIRTGGKQYIVTPGQEIVVEKITAGTPVEILLVKDSAGIHIGNPLLDMTLSFTISEPIKGKKIHILKFKPKKRVLRRMGHRQKFSVLSVS